MIVTRRKFLAAAAAAPALLTVRVNGQSAPGRYPLQLGDDRDGLVYIPKNYTPDKALPLLVMLHGAGNTSSSVQYTFPLADEFGVIILAPDSRDERTWDGVLRNWGPDVDFLAEALAQTVGRYNVDRTRLGVGGFSDGASYALSFGISFGDQFQHVIAMSPGVMQPIAARGKPHIFISHGTADPIMPIDDTSRKFVPKLKSLGYDVTYREYDGRHSPSPPIVREAFEWFLR
ncbi:MAG TPA: alpha/beta hydrolase-fold protein [Vicinamibacterales bacterium]|jgi:phospholipase/carboxylesterase